MRNIKPLYVMRQFGVTDQQMNAVLEGVCELMNLAGVEQHIEISDFGVWRHNAWQNGHGLRPYHSIDWYVQHAQETSDRRDKVNANTVITDLWNEPWQKACPHFDLVVLRSDMYSGEANNNFVIGLAIPNFGTVISVQKFLGLRGDAQMQCIKTETMHEMGHVFGLPANGRTRNVHECLGTHCTNRCVMRQGLRLPDDWVDFTADRMTYGALCSDCINDLRRFFR